MQEEKQDQWAEMDRIIEEAKARQTTETQASTNGKKSGSAMSKPERLERWLEKLEYAWQRHGLDEEPQIVGKIAEAMADGKGVTLIGSVGAGKTKRLEAIASVAGAEVFGAGELMRMTREFQEKFGEDTGFKMAMKTKKEEFSDDKDHALAIDDLGKEPPEMLSYGTRHDYMTEAIEERYKQWASRKWITIFSTQMSPEEIRKRYPAHIADRIGEMTVPVFLARRSRRVSWL